MIEHFEMPGSGKINMIKINVDKAKEIWLDKWREARKAKFEQLDIEFIKALELNDTNKMQNVSQQKQALRDITKTELPNNVDQIKTIWPEILN